MQKEDIFDFSGKSFKKIIREPKKRVVIGFNENQYGEAVVTTGVPVQTQPDKVTYVKKKTLSYEQYIQQQLAKKR